MQNTMERNSDLLMIELKEILGAKWQIHQALPEMGKKASMQGLKRALEEHHGASEAHLRRLQMIFVEMNFAPESAPCQAVTELLDSLAHVPAGKAFDTAVIGSLRRMEDFEMAASESARQLAREMGREHVAHLLGKNLDEDGRTYRKLVSIAEELLV